ncbi:reverse transcriptase family protein [Paraburkholderia fungorum]|uniref:reverse transcriptase family protein n=1 Tax=Paraburkholderia fungorum TaxID=134537 RepID=UPI001C1EB8E2|nr:reverse transcriptase family protein [Paraburkholderia fungorum]MBU7440925.1 reverse transcriptase family protein [Paraburkholderia fungorum]
MERWSSHQYKKVAHERGVPSAVVENAVAIGREIVRKNPNVQPVFTLRHLAELCEVDYALLRQYVSRGFDPYESFRVRKRPGPNGERRYRIICVPNPPLMKAQRWITQNVLQYGVVHNASVAFAPKSKLLHATEPHCNARWLIKLDIKRFFESIPERFVYRVFRDFGYQALVAFEMARLCTRLYPGPLFDSRKWTSSGLRESPYKIHAYDQSWQGHLPQGAPTSPMLANLVCYKLDELLADLADSDGLQYTRYADDLTFSTNSKEFSREQAAAVVGKVFQHLAQMGFSPNRSKTSVIPPRGRKVVLGLLVDGSRPRLSREFKASLRQHLYYLTLDGWGPVKHAKVRGFASLVGLRDHVLGLIGYAGQIEPAYALARRREFETIKWPI